METEVASRYDAKGIESRWYEKWEKAGLFRSQNNGRPLYTITIPPPNITGSLHMGHALCYPLQDLLGRYHRLRGYDVLIIPGQDHAGIATQVVVSKHLKAQGISPVELGREKFTEKVWEWRKESGDTILRQFKDLGCAFDWERLRFTLDENYVNAVLRVFINWFDRGIIYRGKRVVNWDCVLQTSVSDIEVQRKVVRGHLYHVRYPFADGSGEVVVATTRPETMLADVAVAVHPSDVRYKDQVGKMLRLPLMDREIPLIADIYPDPEFGTGAVKITPAHDPNDYAVGVRHGLAMPVVIDHKGQMTGDVGPYLGLDRREARKRIVQDLQDQGFLVKTEDHDIALLISERSNEIIEPLLSEEWFADQSALKVPAMEAVTSGKVRFFPERYTKVYLEWLEALHDWNISRRLWWGHRIPVYYDEDGRAFAALSWEDAQAKAGDRKIVRQDEDVLDTWFSSGLWPFAVLGWPEQTQDLKDRYPTSVLVTSRDIIFLWVARMIMMGLDQAGDIPFRDVYIYATVLTESGQRMSKSLGTGVDPVSIIGDYGADALRFALFSQTGTNQEIRYGDKKAEEARNFCNKMWNAARFTLMNLNGYEGRKPERLEAVDRWILSKLARCEDTVSRAIEAYDIQEGAIALQKFFWDDLCDWYIEVAKPRLANPSERHVPQWVLVRAFDAYLKLLHPFMPFMSEELYAQLPLPEKHSFLMNSEWPTGLATDEDAESTIERIFAITRGIRALRAEVGIAALKAIDAVYLEGDIADGEEIIGSQAWVGKIIQGKPASGIFISTTVEDVDIHLPVEGLIDLDKERQRLSKELLKAKQDEEKLSAKLNNQNFLERASPEIIEKDRELLEKTHDLITKLESRIELFGG